VLVPEAARESDVACAGMMPYMQWLALVSYPDANSFFAGAPFLVTGFRSHHGPEALAAILTALVLYGMAALILTGATIDGLARTLQAEVSSAKPRPPSPTRRVRAYDKISSFV
jgi:hypothetical protein